MSCLNCEEFDNKPTYVRVDKANVGLIGCDEHLGKVLASLAVVREMEQAGDLGLLPWNRPIVRLK